MTKTKSLAKELRVIILESESARKILIFHERIFSLYIPRSSICFLPFGQFVQLNSLNKCENNTMWQSNLFRIKHSFLEGSGRP